MDLHLNINYPLVAISIKYDEYIQYQLELGPFITRVLV